MIWEICKSFAIAATFVCDMRLCVESIHLLQHCHVYAMFTGFSCHSSVKEGVRSGYGAPVVTFFCNLQLTDLPGNIRVSEVFSVEPVINLQTGKWKLLTHLI